MSKLKYISDSNLKLHITNTIKEYRTTLESIDINKFNSNIIDPIKLIFDAKVYQKSFEDVVDFEVSRQRDKTNTNSIGYFHQNIFRYISDCTVPAHGWDVIVMHKGKQPLYVEMKNKHNTMNSTAAAKTMMKMQSQILKDPRSNCALVEVIARHSQNIPWTASVDGVTMKDERIRRISIDKFYEIATGEKDAFVSLCRVLPQTIEDIVKENTHYRVVGDTVIAELKNINPDIVKALYKLSFHTYNGFDKI